MSDESKVIAFPGSETAQEEIKENETVEAVQEEIAESGPIELDPENPINEMSMKQIEELMKQAEMMVQIMQNQWSASARELHINDTHMKELGKWNDDHRTPMPEDISEEERNNWDHLNGIDCITEEEVNRIFGEEHPIHGVMFSQTVDRIKAACNDFFGWLTTMREYRQIHDAYLELLEVEEEKNIEVLKAKAEEEEDPEKKAKMQESIDLYYDRKFLGWLAKPFAEDERDRILKALGDPKKIEYWLERCRTKLSQLKISQKFILEIAQFEQRFLPEKYHKANNVLLLYFMATCGYCKASDPEDDGRVKTVCMVIALDAFIRNTWREERKQNLLNNIIAFEDQFIDFIKEPETEHEVTPPITEESESVSE